MSCIARLNSQTRNNFHCKKISVTALQKKLGFLVIGAGFMMGLVDVGVGELELVVMEMVILKVAKEVSNIICTVLYSILNCTLYNTAQYHYSCTVLKYF